MKITINGSDHECPEGIQFAQLLDSLELSNEKIALEVNRSIIPRSEYASHIVNEGDTVEIIKAVGGG